MTEERIILDLCGGTGAWSRPWKLNGYDVRVITLPEHMVGHLRCYSNRNTGTQKRDWIYSRDISQITFCH